MTIDTHPTATATSGEGDYAAMMLFLAQLQFCRYKYAHWPDAVWDMRASHCSTLYGTYSSTGTCYQRDKRCCWHNSNGNDNGHKPMAKVMAMVMAKAVERNKQTVAVSLDRFPRHRWYRIYNATRRCKRWYID